jgi:hypothetical protein
MTPKEVAPLKGVAPVSIAAPISDQHKTAQEKKTRHLAITDGEIHFLWWFIQGSIMTPETRNALLRGFGFCERHAWAHLSVEMSFRKRHFLGPVILYRALAEKSVQAFRARPHVGLVSPLRHLQAAGRCFLCALNIDHSAAGAAQPTRLARGRDSSGLRSFATELAEHWRPKVCAICANAPNSSNRCRPHLLADLKSRKAVDLSCQQDTVEELAARLARYEKSFVAGADEPTDQDRAALISAAGWCSGWRPLLALLGGST